MLFRSVHVEADGSWRLGHLPLDDQGVLTVSEVTAAQLPEVVRALWEDGTSTAPAA